MLCSTSPLSSELFLSLATKICLIIILTRIIYNSDYILYDSDNDTAIVVTEEETYVTYSSYQRTSSSD
ncbi:unnamed protein product [Caenorhabditis nigoni]